MMIDCADQLLLNLGFHQLRVRIHGMNVIGFTYVTMNLVGYRSGSMNETLPINEKSIID